MIKVRGHRGARELWPENSLHGFRQSIALGVDIVELDVHLSRDGEIMVIHDPTLERTTLGSGLVAEKTAANLARTPLRDCDEGVPTLAAVLDLFAGASTELMIEVKTDALGRRYPGIERRILAAAAQRGMQARTGIVSFVPEVLEEARRVEPSVQLLAPVFRPTSQMLGGLERMLDRLDAIPGCLVSIERSMLQVAREYCMQRLGPRMCVGVTNDERELNFWMTQPVRHVSSDRPDLALAARARRLASSGAAGQATTSTQG